MTVAAAETRPAPAGTATRRTGRKRYDGAMPYLLVLPGLACYALFVLSPIVQTVQLSFQRTDGLTTPVWVGLRNFTDILTDPQQLASFAVSLAMVFFTCLLPVAVALALVGLIARTRVRGLSVLRFLYFLPYTVALAVVAIAWRWLYATDGSINEIVGAVFGHGAVTDYLGNFDLALPAIGVVGFWATFGYVTVLLLSGTQHVSRELYEAARMDGAGPLREFLVVTLPGVRQELRVALVMTFIMAMRTFDLPLMTTAGGPGYTTTTPSLLMYQDVFENGKVGSGAAIAVLLTLVMVVGVVLINRTMSAKD